MHLVEAKEGIDIYSAAAGRYYVDDLNAADIIRMSPRGSVKAWSIDAKFKPFDEARDWNGKRILFIRPGGMGDLLFMTPSFREIKRRWPTAEIHVAAFGPYQSVLKTAQIEKIMSYPVDADEANGYDAVVPMENVIEGNPDAERDHAVDVIASWIGLSSLADKHCTYEFTQEETDWAAARYPRTEKRRIAIHLSASGKCRNYPASMNVEIIKHLHKQGHEVYMLGYPREVTAPTPDGIRNLTMENLSFRQSVAAMATCDVLVGPDSVMVHIAGAIGMKAVALYGPFPWKLRTAYAPSVSAIQGHSGCDKAPCFFHGQGNHMHFPKDGPCAKTGRCEVMASIKVQRVIAAVNSALENP